MSALYMIVGTMVTLGVLVTFHDFGHFWAARRCGDKVLRFSVGFGMPLMRWHDCRGTEFVIASVPMGSYVKMFGEGELSVDQLDQSLNCKTVCQRIAILAAGPITKFLLAMVFFWVLAMMGGQQVRPVISAVEANSIAAKAGLVAGQQVVDLVRVHPGAKIVLKVEREGAQINLPVTLSIRRDAKVATGYLGVRAKDVEWPPSMLRELSLGLSAAMSESAKHTWTMSALILESLKKMLFGELSVKNLSGPITIAKVAGDTARSGVADLLSFLTYLSTSFGVLNLLPIPVLDGGVSIILSSRVGAWSPLVGLGAELGDTDRYQFSGWSDVVNSG